MACCKKQRPDKYIFNPDYSDVALTEKFYARHECLNFAGVTNNQQNERIQYYCNEMEKIRNYDAREHFLVPRYTNQEYGWWRGLHMERCKDDYAHSNILRQAIKTLYHQSLNEEKCRADYCKNKKLLHYDHWKIV